MCWEINLLIDLFSWRKNINDVARYTGIIVSVINCVELVWEIVTQNLESDETVPSSSRNAESMSNF